MKQTVKFLAVAVLIALPQTAQLSEVTHESRVTASLYNVTPYWKQTMIFPRWGDTYEVLFEQEMLA